jgi:flagellar protein FliJ
MAKFEFNFEQLLNIKKKIEKQEQMKLGKLMQQLSAAMQQQEIMKYQYKESVSKMQSLLNSGQILPIEIKRSNENIAFYHGQVEAQERIVKGLELQVEQGKEDVKKALQERKTFEILKEKALELYLEEEKQAEAKLIDEIVSFKYKDS